MRRFPSHATFCCSIYTVHVETYFYFSAVLPFCYITVLPPPPFRFKFTMPARSFYLLPGFCSGLHDYAATWVLQVPPAKHTLHATVATHTACTFTCTHAFYLPHLFPLGLVVSCCYYCTCLLPSAHMIPILHTPAMHGGLLTPLLPPYLLTCLCSCVPTYILHAFYLLCVVSFPHTTIYLPLPPFNFVLQFENFYYTPGILIFCVSPLSLKLSISPLSGSCSVPYHTCFSHTISPFLCTLAPFPRFPTPTYTYTLPYHIFPPPFVPCPCLPPNHHPMNFTLRTFTHTPAWVVAYHLHCLHLPPVSLPCVHFCLPPAPVSLPAHTCSACATTAVAFILHTFCLTTTDVTATTCAFIPLLHLGLYTVSARLIPTCTLTVYTYIFYFLRTYLPTGLHIHMMDLLCSHHTTCIPASASVFSSLPTYVSSAYCTLSTFCPVPAWIPGFYYVRHAACLHLRRARGVPACAMPRSTALFKFSLGLALHTWVHFCFAFLHFCIFPFSFLFILLFPSLLLFLFSLSCLFLSVSFSPLLYPFPSSFSVFPSYFSWKENQREKEGGREEKSKEGGKIMSLLGLSLPQCYCTNFLPYSA